MAFPAAAQGWSSELFPDPFMDIASLAMPATIQDALRWVEYIMVKNGPYREALGRVISYFITDVEIVSSPGARIGREERQKYLDFLNDTLGISAVLQSVALDFLVYGNSFTSVLLPFRRYLNCPGCGLELPLRHVYNSEEFQFSWSGYRFRAACPHCAYSGAWQHVDRRAIDPERVRVKRWSPHEIDVLWDPYTDEVSHIWRIPDDYRNLIRRGHLFHLERASWEIIKAVEHNQALQFDQDVVYHMREEGLAGLRNRGWGFSRVLTNFGQAFYVQILHRYNEAIALDYVIPFRVLTPMPRPGTGGPGGEINDPVLSINMGGFVGRVNEMLRARRRDPARWNVLPYPLQYQALGGDANTLAPHELIAQGMDTLLNAAGVPVELYKGTLSVQAAPSALRLFEANWSHLVHKLNRFLNKLTDKVSQILGWEPIVARLTRVSHADDLNRQMAKLQLMMGGMTSRTTGLASVGLDFIEEERRKVEEDRVSAELAQDQQAEMEEAASMDEMAMPAAPPGSAPPGGAPGMAMAPGGMPPGGAPPGGMPPGGAPPLGPMGQPMGPGGAATAFGASMGTQPMKPQTPEEMMQQASMEAQRIMTMPESQKDSTLIRLKREDPVMHSLVSSQVEEIRRNARMQGGEMVMQQQFGGGL